MPGARSRGMIGVLKWCGMCLAVASTATAGNLSEMPHPRLWFPKSAEAEVQQRIAKDPLAAGIHQALLRQAETALKDRTCIYLIPDGRRLLHESRRALSNILHCAWAWRSTGDERFRQRCIAEMVAACELQDWNPSHFLDTAEMATAVAIGYDWLHPSLTQEQREMCERAIVEKALIPAKSAYAKGGYWTVPKNNWAQVCGAGIALAAAAISDVHPELAGPLFEKGYNLVHACDAFYQPDGMYPEGPAYWQYGTNFHVMLLAAAEQLGRATPQNNSILEPAGNAMMHLNGSSGLTFNFADGNPSSEPLSPAQAWIAKKFQNTTQAQQFRDHLSHALQSGKGKIPHARYGPLALLWLPPAPGPGPLEHPTAATFGGEQAMAFFRTDWTRNAAWLAIKGGTAAANHGHMDGGSFAYDAHGTRWIHDPGSESYQLPGYFSHKRWTYFRLQNRSHSTLEIAEKLQNPKAKPCPIVSSSLTGNSLAVAFDLSNAYPDSATKIIRSARFDSRSGSCQIEDQITKPLGDVVWRAIIDASAEIQGRDVILRKGDKQITLHRISKSGTWSVSGLTPPSPEENPNTGLQALVLSVPQAAQTSIIVEIRP